MTDVAHDVQTDGMDDAQTGATTDIPYDVQMDGMDDAQTGAMTDILYDVWMDGDLLGYCAGNFPCFSPHNYKDF